MPHRVHWSALTLMFVLGCTSAGEWSPGDRVLATLPADVISVHMETGSSALAVVRQYGDRIRVQCDGGAMDFDSVEQVELSKNGEHVGVAGTRDGMEVLVVGGVVLRATELSRGRETELDGLLRQARRKRTWIGLAPDGALIEAIRMRGVGSTGSLWMFTIDGEAVAGSGWRPHGDLEDVHYSRDGATYWYETFAGGLHRQLVRRGPAGVVRRKLGKDTQTVFGPDGPAGVLHGRGKRVVIGDRTLGPWNDIRLPIRFDASGEHYVFCAERDRQWYMVHDGRLEAAGDRVLSISPGGNRLAYWTRDKSELQLVVGDQRLQGGELRGNHHLQRKYRYPRLVWSLSGRHLAFVRRRSGNPWPGSQIVTSLQGPIGPGLSRVGRLFVTDDGRPVCLARTLDKTQVLIVGGDVRRLAGEPLTDLVSNAEQTRVAFGMRRGGEVLWRVIDLAQH